MSLSRPRGIPRGARGMISELLRLAAAAGGRLERPRRRRHVPRRRRRVGRPRDQARGHHRVEQVSPQARAYPPRPGASPAAAAFSPPRPSSRGPASSPEAGDITPAGRLHRRRGFRKGLAYARPLRPRAISPRSRATKSVSSGSRSLRRTSSSTFTQAAAVSRRADSRQSHTATMHWQQGC